MVKLIAVDVALLPPPAIMKEVMGLIDYSDDSVLKLNMQHCLPHVTVLMGVMDESRVGEAQELLETFVPAVRKLEATITHTQTLTLANGKKLHDATLAPSRELVDLFVQIKKAFAPLLSPGDVTTDMFYSPPAVADISVTWVERFGHKGPDDFRPHITLGEGAIRQIKQPITFVPNRMVLCHLGNYCTCRDVLAQAHIF